jgi:DNA repair protein RadA/Sms
MAWTLSIFSFAIVVCLELFWVPSIYCWSTFTLQQTFPLHHQARRRLQTTTELYANINDEDEDEEEDDEPPEVDIRDFKYPSGMDTSNKGKNGNKKEASPSSFGLGRGRSSGSQRKAMGSSSKTSTTVHICSNCGSESVQWLGRCPTCKEWNSFQEVKVQRSKETPSSKGPVGGIAHNLLEGRSRSQNNYTKRRQTDPASSNQKLGGQSWLDGIATDTSSHFNNYDGPSNRPVSISDIDLEGPKFQRLKIPNDDEMNDVLGGGLMKGSLILLGGDPGVGKSTLALQMAAQLASLSVAPSGVGMGPSLAGSEAAVGPVWYVSGEETLEQIATRAQRLIASNNDNNDTDSVTPSSAKSKLNSLPKQLFLLSETNLNLLTDEVLQIWMDEQNNSFVQNEPNALDSSSLQTPPNNLAPSLIIIDSIQTMVCEAGGSSSAGGISQVRESMALLLRLAKSTQIPILAIGHVTKTGDVAGPRMVEHMVDAVLYLEHSQSSVSSSLSNANFRWLRAQKNRFGSCQEAGLYDFRDGILVPLPEGTESALAPPADDLEGCSMGICVEGRHRAMTVEVQALVTVASASFGKKTVEGGLSSARLNLLLGILQKHCQLPIAGGGRTSRDVYVNVVGCEGAVSKSQLSLATMALDLAVAVALTSSYLRIPARGDIACLAQVGLLGELRPLSSLESRLLQAQRMGFSTVIVASPHKSSRSKRKKNYQSSQKQKQGNYFSSGSDDEESRTRSTRKFGLDVYECSTLKEALDLALTSPIPARSRRQNQKKSSSPTDNSNRPERQTSPPGSLRDLNLDDEIMDLEDEIMNLEDEALLDDEDDEYDLL